MPVAVGVHEPQGLAEGVVQRAEPIALGDQLAERRVEMQDAGTPRADPATGPGLDRRGGRRLVDRLGHRQCGQHSPYADDARIDRRRRRSAGSRRPRRAAPSRPARGPRAAANRRGCRRAASPARRRPAASSRVSSSSRSARICGRLERRSEPVWRSRPTSHLATTSVMKRCAIRAGQRPARGAGEGAVEVAAVGEVAVAGHEAQDVDDGYGDERAVEGLRVEPRQHLPDHLDPDDLVAVDRGTQPDRRPVLAAVDHAHRQADVGAGDQPHDRQLEVAGRARPDPDGADAEGFASHGVRVVGQGAHPGAPPGEEVAGVSRSGSALAGAVAGVRGGGAGVGVRVRLAVAVEVGRLTGCRRRWCHGRRSGRRPADRRAGCPSGRRRPSDRGSRGRPGRWWSAGSWRRCRRRRSRLRSRRRRSPGRRRPLRPPSPCGRGRSGATTSSRGAGCSVGISGVSFMVVPSVAVRMVGSLVSTRRWRACSTGGRCAPAQPASRATSGRGRRRARRPR